MAHLLVKDQDRARQKLALKSIYVLSNSCENMHAKLSKLSNIDCCHSMYLPKMAMINGNDNCQNSYVHPTTPPEILTRWLMRLTDRLVMFLNKPH